MYNDSSNRVSYMAVPGIPMFLVSHNPSPRPSPEEIVCKEFGISLEVLKTVTRKREVVIPRQVALTLISITGISLTLSGKKFGKDHATVLHSKRRTNELLETKHPYSYYSMACRAIRAFAVLYPEADLSGLQGRGIY